MINSLSFQYPRNGVSHHWRYQTEFGNESEGVYYAYERLEVGGVIVNDAPSFRADNMPYGGARESGIGREGVRYAMEEMTEPKLLVLNLT